MVMKLINQGKETKLKKMIERTQTKVREKKKKKTTILLTQSSHKIILAFLFFPFIYKIIGSNHTVLR